MRFTFIRAEKATWPVRAMCRVLGVSPAGYYSWCKRVNSPRTASDEALAVAIAASHAKSRGTYGSPRIHADLRAQGVRVSRKRVIRIMRARGLRGAKRKGWVRTTEADAAATPAPNLLDRDFTASKPDERWVGDVTYLRTPAGWLYLAVVMDLFSRRVVGWALSPYNDRKLATAGWRPARAPGDAREVFVHLDVPQAVFGRLEPGNCPPLRYRPQECGPVTSRVWPVG